MASIIRFTLLALLPLGFTLGCVTTMSPPVRQTPQSLMETAPDQERFHELLGAADAAVEDAAAKDFDADAAQAADASRNERIAALEVEAENGASEMKKANAVFELAKLYQERAFYQRDLAVRDFQMAMDRWWIGEQPTAPELQLGPWKETLLKRINVLRDMAAHYPKDPRIADINWQIASTMARLGNDHSEQYFKQATHLARTPEAAAKVKISQADWLAAQGKVDEALAAYAALRENTVEDFKPYVTYRLGWSYLTKAAKAASPERRDLEKKGEAALKLAFLAAKPEPTGRFDLRRQAARDLAWLWATQDNEQAPTEFFEKHDQPQMLAEFRAKQADEWLRRGQTDKARAYFDAQTANNPEDPKAPDYRLKLAYAYVVAGDVKGVQGETDSLAKLTTEATDGGADNPWLEAHGEDETLVNRARIMQTRLPLVAGYRLYEAAEAEKDDKRRRTLYGAAAKALQEQIAKVSDPAQVLAIRVMMIKAMIGLERHREALDQLDAVVKLGPKAGPQLAGVAYERLNILVKLDGEQTYPEVPAPGEVKKPLPLPELKARFAAAAEDYIRIAPDAEIVPNLRFQIANDLFNYGHYDEALPRFEAFINDYPKAEATRTAIEVCLSMNLKRKQWDELVRLSTAFLNNRNIKGKSLRDYIKENLDWAKEQSKGAMVH